MSGSRRPIVIGLVVAAVLFAAVAVAAALMHSGSRTTPAFGPGMMSRGYNGMMGGGYGYSNVPPRRSNGKTQAVALSIRSDTEHGKLGPDGNWHDAFLPADFTVHAGDTVTVTAYNYDSEPHSFSSPSLGVNQTIPGGSASAPQKVTFTFTAPSKSGRYQWWCALPCDPYAMATDGFMRGNVTVSA
jgi:plastocyanin